MKSLSRGRICSGLAAIAIGVLLNPWTVAWLFSPDGELEAGSSLLIFGFDGLMIVIGLLCLFASRSLIVGLGVSAVTARDAPPPSRVVMAINVTVAKQRSMLMMSPNQGYFLIENTQTSTRCQGIVRARGREEQCRVSRRPAFGGTSGAPTYESWRGR